MMAKVNIIPLGPRCLHHLGFMVEGRKPEGIFGRCSASPNDPDIGWVQCSHTLMIKLLECPVFSGF